jgi:hypothetical protein
MASLITNSATLKVELAARRNRFINDLICSYRNVITAQDERNKMTKYLAVLFILSSTTAAIADSTYQVEAIYESVEVATGAIALDRMGRTVDVSELLVPAQLKAGTYQISVTRKDTNFYRIDGYNYYIKTRLCLELALSQKAYLEVNGMFSKLTFVSRF